MAVIGKEYAFEAAHQIPNHNGKCARLHGHSYRVIVELSGPIMTNFGASDHGMVVDFYHLDEVVKPLIARLDHQNLNDIIPYPTAEIIGVWFYEQVAAHFHRDNDFDVMAVTVYETAKAFAKVTEDDRNYLLATPGRDSLLRR